MVGGREPTALGSFRALQERETETFPQRRGRRSSFSFWREDIIMKGEIEEETFLKD